MDLYALLLCFRDGKNLQFHYRSKSTVEVAYAALTTSTPLPPIMNSPAVGITDDYGNVASIKIGDLSGVVMTFVNEDLNAQADRAILQAHAQQKAQRRAAADPMLKGLVPANGAMPPPFAQ